MQGWPSQLRIICEPTRVSLVRAMHFCNLGCSVNKMSLPSGVPAFCAMSCRSACKSLHDLMHASCCNQKSTMRCTLDCRLAQNIPLYRDVAKAVVLHCRLTARMQRRASNRMDSPSHLQAAVQNSSSTFLHVSLQRAE